MSGINIANGTAASAEMTVDTNGDAHVVLPTVATRAGYTRLLGEMSGSSDAAGLAVNPLQSSPARNLAVGMETNLFDLEFVGTTVPQAHILQATSTFTIAQAGGFIVLNSGAVTTINASASVRSYLTFPLYAGMATVIAFRAKLTNSTVSNKVAELGVGLASANSAPTDGIMFRWNASGAFLGVINYNGTENTVSLTHPGDAANTNTYKIVIDQAVVRYYVNDSCVGSQTLLSVVATQAGVTSSMNLPMFARLYNSGSAPASASVLSVARMSCFLLDDQTALPLSHQLVMAGAGGYQTQNGSTSGNTSNWTNSLAFSSFTLSNTAAGSTALGGLYQFAAAAGAATDYALFGYQIPTGTATLPGRTFFVTGFHATMANAGAANSATVPTTCLFGLGVGSTAVSLATTDAATTLGPRRIPLGMMSIPVNAVVGQGADREIHVRLSAPVPCPSGTFLHVIMRIVSGAATASQLIQGSVYVEGFWR